MYRYLTKLIKMYLIRKEKNILVVIFRAVVLIFIALVETQRFDRCIL